MDVLRHAPALTLDEAARLALRLFGVDATASPLPSERDQNVLLLTPDGDHFVLKVANRTDDRALLEAQNAALAHVARSTTLCPRVIPTPDGNEIGELTTRTFAMHLLRLLRWLPGVPLASLPDHPPPLLESLGAAVAEPKTSHRANRPNRIDPGSYAFRYPTESIGRGAPARTLCRYVPNFAEALEVLLGCLEGAADLLDGSFSPKRKQGTSWSRFSRKTAKASKILDGSRWIRDASATLLPTFREQHNENAAKARELESPDVVEIR